MAYERMWDSWKKIGDFWKKFFHFSFS